MLIANFDKVIVKELERKKETAGGLIIPDSSNSDVRTGKVISNGVLVNDEKFDEHDIQKDDIIFYKSTDATEITSENEKFYVIDTENVLAIERN